MPNLHAVATQRRRQLFRTVNDRIRAVVRELSGLGAVDRPIEFLCECGAAECRATVALTIAEYDLAASTPGRLLFALEHRGMLDGHDVVAEHRRYAVAAPAS
jgi:hypothetical protein